jgi:cobalt/nickel transport system permease protein
MRHSFVDRFSRIDSPVHRLPIAIKIAGTVLLLLIIAVLPPFSLPVVGCITPFLFVVSYASRIPAGFLLRRMLFLEVFAIGISVLSLLQPDGLVVFAGLLVKSSLSLFVIVLFSNTTPFSGLLDTLKAWGCPSLFVTLLALMYRYLFVLIDEMERMQRARGSRTFTGGAALRWRSLATVISQLFIRSMDRADRIFAAMSARGWQ